MEPLYLIKLHLKSNYEEFFFTTRDKSNKFAQQSLDEKVTIKRVKVTYDRKTFENRMTDIKYPDKTNIEKIFFGL